MEASMPVSAGEDERVLLMRLEQLLEREHARIVACDAPGLTAVAEEREHLTARLTTVARARRAGTTDEVVDAELLSLYQRLRRQHEVQALVVRRHLERNTRAIGVLAQAAGRSEIYQANGRVAMQFVAA